MESITYQPDLRPALPHIKGSKEYRDERQLLINIDEILSTSGLENDFIAQCLKQQRLDREKTSASAKRLASFANHCVLALRSNIARHLKGMSHREFCIRLADSPLLQWFLKIGRVEGVKAFAKFRTKDGRKHRNDKKILSLYDPDVQVIKRGKSGAEIEFGNNLWVLARLERREATGKIREPLLEAA